jgi:hypothetical protein
MAANSHPRTFKPTAILPELSSCAFAKGVVERFKRERAGCRHLQSVSVSESQSPSQARLSISISISISIETSHDEENEDEEEED